MLYFFGILLVIVVDGYKGTQSALWRAADARNRLNIAQNEKILAFGSWFGSTSRGAAPRRSFLMSSTEAEGAEKTQTKSKSKGDFSAFVVGQQYDGQVLSAKVFGVFVDISKGYNVLIPKSKMSAGNFNKLKEMADSQSTERVKVEIISVDATNQTLSAKYVDPNFKERKAADLSVFTEGQQLVGTVVSTHEFGCFVNLKEFDVDGLLPMSKMRGMTVK